MHEQADDGAAALQQRVQADGRAVQEVLGAAATSAAASTEPSTPQDALVGRGGDGRHLADHDAPGLVVAQRPGR